jgi:polysaccharide export outer membrane protein
MPRLFSFCVLLFACAACACADSTDISAPVARSGPAAAPGPVSWRVKYTLGPGDTMDIDLYGRQGMKREGLFVEPDGSISYLQATDVHADGLTFEELRAKLEEVLSQYYKRPRVLIAPMELRSKKFFILGKAVDNGAFVMDRPTTLVEALARAKGLETGLVENRYAELADLSRSFLVRNGRRVPVDFEALFQKGDLSQNIQIEPNDYIYIALSRTSDIYLYGEVERPGVQAFTPHLTVMATVTGRGGYTPGAWREKVLVVRGSLRHPQVFSVNTNAILKGKQRDFELQPNDIVYVSGRPWVFADEVLDAAISSFVQAATSTWASDNVPALITRPILPQIRSAINLQ